MLVDFPRLEEEEGPDKEELVVAEVMAEEVEVVLLNNLYREDSFPIEPGEN